MAVLLYEGESYDPATGNKNFSFVWNRKSHTVTPRSDVSDSESKLEKFKSYVRMARKYKLGPRGYKPGGGRRLEDVFIITPPLPGITDAEQMKMDLCASLDRIASSIEEKGLFQEAYQIDLISNTLDKSWNSNQANLFFDEMTNLEIKPEEAKKILRAFEEGADTEFSVSEVTGIDAFKCKRVLDEAQKRGLLNKTAAVSHPAWLANKVQIVYEDPTGKEIKRTEGRISTGTRPRAFPDLWAQGDDGKWYLQQADEISVHFKSGEPPVLENQLTGERQVEPGAQQVEMSEASKVIAPEILRQLNLK